MKKISLALIASFIAAPLCATSAPSALPIASLFGGYRMTLGGEYDVNFAGSYTAIEYPEAYPNRRYILGMPVPNRMGKISFDFGYTKVCENHVILGAAVFGAYVPKFTAGPESELVLLNDDGTVICNIDLSAAAHTQTLGRDWLAGFRVNAGIVVMPNVAVKIIGEVGASRYFFDTKSTVELKGTSKEALFSGAIGGGVDVAVTDRIVFGIGAKYNWIPKTFATETKSIFGFHQGSETYTVHHFGKSISIFAEIGYRLTQE